MKNKILPILIISFLAILVVGGIVYFIFLGPLQSVFEAPPEWDAYGSSGSAITGLQLISQGYLDTGYHITDYLSTHTSTYWDITQLNHRNWDCGADLNYYDFGGNDFELFGGYPRQGSGPPGGCSSGTTTTFITKQYFGNGREFRSLVRGSPTLKLLSSANVNIANLQIDSSQDEVLEIKSDPFSDTVEIFWKGQLAQTITTSESFKLRFDFSAGGIKNPAFKDAYSCQVEPDEQYYFYIFGEGSTVSKSGLENWNSWCLESAPAQIWTNAGKTTSSFILKDLEAGNTFTVPPGQFWGIEYIGDKKILQTPCEQDQVLVNGDECTARTVLEFQFMCDGGQLDVITGECIPSEEITENDTTEIILESSAVQYNPPTNQQLVFLNNSGMFRLTHYHNDDPDVQDSPSSFNLFGTTFQSNGASNENTASFTYESVSETLSEGQIVNIDNKISVQLTRVNYHVSSQGRVSYQVEWTFQLSSDLLSLSYDDIIKEILSLNEYKSFNGGFTLIKEDTSQTETSETISETFNVGETRTSIGDISDINTIIVRPHATIILPDFTYNIAIADGLVIDDLQEEEVVVSNAEPDTDPDIIIINLADVEDAEDEIIKKEEEKINIRDFLKENWILVISVLGGLVIIGGGTILFVKFKMPRRRR